MDVFREVDGQPRIWGPVTPDAEASPIMPDGGEGRARAKADEHLLAEVANLDAVNATLRPGRPAERRGTRGR